MTENLSNGPFNSAVDRGNFYYDYVENHPLEGKTVDFDWRGPKEKGLPYDPTNENVVQRVFIKWVGKNCHGELFCFCDGYLQQSVNRVVKVY